MAIAVFGISALDCIVSRLDHKTGGPQMADTKRSYPQFFYRRNSDNTMDAICGFCFLTVASAESEADLHALESVHQCNQEDILVDRRHTPTWEGGSYSR
jgi:hypothetical protein